MKTEYMVETSENLITTREFEEDLVRKVNILMKDGWQPIGNPFQDKHGQWLQALVR
tara:strand:- start:113 stop:280 length:168 start_codon:yes stop_codon:yes gene_type:complete